jgi:hypothetical protein
MPMYRPHRSILWVSALLAGMCAAPRPTLGGEWSPEYQAGLRKTAERNNAIRMRKKEVAKKQQALRQATAAKMQQAAMEEAAMMERIAAMQQAIMMQKVAMQQAAMAQSAASRGYRLGGRLYTIDDTFATVGATFAYVNALEMNRMSYGYGSYGAAPEIDAGPAAAALALLASGMLMLADRRRTRSA